MQNFKKFGAIFVIFEILKVKSMFFQQVVLRFCWGNPFAKKFILLELAWKNMHA